MWLGNDMPKIVLRKTLPRVSNEFEAKLDPPYTQFIYICAYFAVYAEFCFWHYNK